MEAILYKKLLNNVVQCDVCAHYCVIEEGKRGICGVRENKLGTLYALNFGKTIATSIDPIEKKPLYEFMPNTKTYSFATVGCNMVCPWCQNYDISQSPKPRKNILGENITPEEHLKMALYYQCPSISYTYSEPTIFLEYALETMKLAKENNLKNIWVSNGYMSKETLELILPYLDAANIDYKGQKQVYEKYCFGNALLILENMKKMKQANVHLEVTTLVIPGINDKETDIKSIVNDLIMYLGKDIIWHITRFFPDYKMRDFPITPKDTLFMAQKIGHDAGIKKIYLGNI